MGPLWSYSMFGFENMNGRIKCLMHETKDVPHQYSLYVPINQNATTQVRSFKKQQILKQFVTLNVAVHVAVLSQEISVNTLISSEK